MKIMRLTFASLVLAGLVAIGFGLGLLDRPTQLARQPITSPPNAPVKRPIRQMRWVPKSDILFHDNAGVGSGVAFSTDLRRIIVGGHSTIGVFDLWSGLPRESFMLLDDMQMMRVSPSPDGRLLALCGHGRSEIVLWDLPRGREAARLPGHGAFTRHVAFSSDGKVVVSCGIENGRDWEDWDTPTDQRVRLWSVEGGAELGGVVGGIRGGVAAALSPDGKTLAVADPGNPLRMLEIASGREMRTFPDPLGHTYFRTNAIAFSPDGKTLAAGNGHAICLMDAESGRILASLGPASTEFRLEDTRDVCFTQDGEVVAGGGTETGDIALWNTTTGVKVAEFKGKRGDAQHIAISPDGRWLVSVGWSTLIKRWELQAVVRD